MGSEMCIRDRIIYGYNLTSEELLEKAGVEPLKTRRETLFNKFCLKTYNNDRFKNAWFETREFVGHDLRKQKILIEKPASSNRLYTSPLYAMRRRTNDLLIS